MKRLLNWLKESNRYKHIIGGLGIGLLSCGWYCAAFAGIGIASALEFKDKQWGGKWDWIDWGMTVLGVAIGYLINFMIWKLM